MYLEDWGFWESLYFTVITISTVGYGDMTPTSVFKKIITIIYLYIGIAFVASIVGAWIGIFIGKILHENLPDDSTDSIQSTPGETQMTKQQRYLRQDIRETVK